MNEDIKSWLENNLLNYKMMADCFNPKPQPPN